MDYIKGLREKIGHQKILIPATAIVILREKDEILLQLRSDDKSWGLPGGLMDLGETVLQCVVRETLEETGLRIHNPKFFGIFSGPQFETKYSNGDETAPVILGFFTADYDGKLLSTSEESLKNEFFPLQALPEAMNPFHRKFVEGYQRFQEHGTELIL